MRGALGRMVQLHLLSDVEVSVSASHRKATSLTLCSGVTPLVPTARLSRWAYSFTLSSVHGVGLPQARKCDPVKSNRMIMLQCELLGRSKKRDQRTEMPPSTTDPLYGVPFCNRRRFGRVVRWSPVQGGRFAAVKWNGAFVVPPFHVNPPRCLASIW